MIKVTHPTETSKVLLIKPDFSKETKHSFDEVAPFSELESVDHNRYVAYGNCYSIILCDEIGDYASIASMTPEELEYEIRQVYAPSLDALIRCFLDTTRLDENDEYKVWSV